jgi:hypothetical protein
MPVMCPVRNVTEPLNPRLPAAAVGCAAVAAELWRR